VEVELASPSLPSKVVLDAEPIIRLPSIPIRNAVNNVA